MARPQQPEAWWEKWRHAVSADYLSYIKAEDHATQVDTYYSLVLPGIVQTEAYARAVMLSSATFLRSQKRLDNLVELRMLRQWHVLERNPPPKLRLIVDEGVLYRPIGGVQCLRDQLRHIVTLTDLSHISFRVLPLAASDQLLCIEAGFKITSGVKTQLFVETWFGEKSQTDPIVLLKYQDSFEQLFDDALDDKQSLVLIQKTIKRLDAHEPMLAEVVVR